jgi:hypothetical protein
MRGHLFVPSHTEKSKAGEEKSVSSLKKYHCLRLSPVAMAFRLPTGATSEGRPDLIALLTGREAHERQVREGALERRATAEERRAAAALANK